MNKNPVVRTLYALLAGIILSLFGYLPSEASFLNFGNFQNQQQFLVIHPTTTVTTETSNNTSASDNFQGYPDGNLGASNISKVDVHSLLYRGNNTKVFVHLEPWFCMPDQCSCTVHTFNHQQYTYCNGHIETGYDSNYQPQVNRQVSDMISRGVQGTIIDWYGQNKAIENGTTLKVMTAAGTYNPNTFQFIVMDDGGQYSGCNGVPHCIEQAMISDLTYAAQTFVPSPNYGKAPNGDPYVFFFHPYDGSGNDPAINWDNVWNGVSQYHFQFVFENNGGFTHSHSTGGYAWAQPTQNNGDDPHWSNYLTGFYNYAKTVSPPKYTFGAGLKGFNDTLCLWGSNRLINQHDGQTYLKTFTLINGEYSSSVQLPNLQMVTWNDYDEGTELESGIDNGVSISASVNSDTGLLSWNVQNDGNPTTLDHFTVYVSTDDFNLMVLQDNIPVTQTSLSLTPYNLPSHTFLRVKAVGKPMILNHLSAGGVEFGGSGGGQGAIMGQITNASNGQGVNGVTVSCSLGQQTTQGNGNYTFNNVQPGHYTLTTSATGWLPNQMTVIVQNSPVTANIPIATAGKIAGTVMNTQGHGLAGANVNCQGGVLPINQNYITDSNGNYGSSWIPVTQGGPAYTCSATAMGFQPSQQAGIQVTAGNTTQVDFTLRGGITPNP